MGSATRNTVPAALCLLVLALAPTRAGAELPFLLDLPATHKSWAGVRYTPGSLDRASHVQDRLGLLVDDFDRWTDQKQPLFAYLLSRTEWEEVGVRIPYGLPARLPDGGIVLAAWGDKGMVALWRELLNGALPEIEGTPLRGTVEESSSLLALDLLGQVEASRTLVARGELQAAEPRVYDLFAHTLAASAFYRHERGRFNDIAALFRRLAAAEVSADSSHADLRTLLQEQARTFNAAHWLLAKRGEDAPKTLFKLARKKKGALDTSTLRQRFPELAAWLGES